MEKEMELKYIKTSNHIIIVPNKMNSNMLTFD